MPRNVVTIIGRLIYHCAQKRWILFISSGTLRVAEADVVKGVKFVNGIEEKTDRRLIPQYTTIDHESIFCVMGVRLVPTWIAFPLSSRLHEKTGNNQPLCSGHTCLL
jgi:hypothetical protein